MKKNYILGIALLVNVFLGMNAFAQSVPIYNTTHAAANGAEISAAANGPATYMGDQIVLAGTNRLLNSITVDLFNLQSNAPFTLTMRLYTACASGAGGCGTGPGTLIPGSEVIVPVTPTVAVSTKFSVTFPFTGVDLTSETDNSIAVMINASRPDVYWVLNETVAVGSTPAGEVAGSVVIRCGSTVAASNGCTRSFTGAINNFAMTVTASPSLGIAESEFSKSISVFPNPSREILNISTKEPGTVNRIQIYDLAGRLIKNLAINSSDSVLQVNIGDLSVGNYILKVLAESGTAVKKIVKQ